MFSNIYEQGYYSGEITLVDQHLEEIACIYINFIA